MTELDQVNQIARANPVDVSYYTKPRQLNDGRIMDNEPLDKEAAVVILRGLLGK